MLGGDEGGAAAEEGVIDVARVVAERAGHALDGLLG
jgi:hypothetical protein